MTQLASAVVPPRKKHLPASEKVFDAQELLGSASQVRIRLDNQIYTLRRTRFGKLLLTK